MIETDTSREAGDEQFGHQEKVVVETKDKTKMPAIFVDGKARKT